MDANKLKSKIVEKGLRYREVSKELSIDPATLNRKLSGISDFSRTELQKLKELLNLSNDEMESIFFN